MEEYEIIKKKYIEKEMENIKLKEELASLKSANSSFTKRDDYTVTNISVTSDVNYDISGTHRSEVKTIYKTVIISNPRESIPN